MTWVHARPYTNRPRLCMCILFMHVCFWFSLGQGVGSASDVGGGNVMTVTVAPFLAWYILWMS